MSFTTVNQRRSAATKGLKVKTKLTLVGLSLAVAAMPAAAAQASVPGKPAVVLKVERGGKAMTVVGTSGRIARIKLARTLSKGIRAGTKVVVANGAAQARGQARSAKIRAVIANRKGRLAAVALDGTALADLLPHSSLRLAGFASGQTVAVQVRFVGNGDTRASLAAPGDSGSPYQDPYADPVPTDPAPCAAASPAPAVTIIAMNRATLRIMVQSDSGDRAKYKVSAEVFDLLHRGMTVRVTDSNSDGIAESVTAARTDWTRGRSIEGTVAWIDTDWGAFGITDSDGRLRVVDASSCQLASISEGDSITATVHRDADGELVADTIDPAPAADGNSTDSTGDGEDGDEDGGTGGYQAGDGAGSAGFRGFWPQGRFGR